MQEQVHFRVCFAISANSGLHGWKARTRHDGTGMNSVGNKRICIQHGVSGVLFSELPLTGLANVYERVSLWGGGHLARCFGNYQYFSFSSN
jgi:hypothetical protein